MVASTWTWFGGSASADIGTNWTLTAGPGNGSGIPGTGDTAIETVGTAVLPNDSQLNSNTVEIGGTAGITAAFDFTGDNFVTFGRPTLDGNTLITNANVPGATTAEATLLDAAGTFINQGSIVANGPAGSTFTVNIHQNATNPGYFINYGQMTADAGNTMTIAVGGTSELFNVGALTADGGTLVVNANPAAIVGGYAPVLGVALIEAGGTFEINNAYPAGFSGPIPTNSGSSPYYIFGDATSGDTLKIDQVQQFGGRILGFQQGDTIDIGTSLSVGTIAYSTATGVLALENAAGTILASLGFSSGDFQNGSTAVSGGVANHVTLTTGADGDTLLTTDLVNSNWINNSGTSTWQTAADWSTGTVPGISSTPVIGLGATSPFTVTTGTTSVSANSLSVVDDNALLQITSNTTVAASFIQQVSGTIEVTSGNTLLASGLRQFYPNASLLLDKGSVVDFTGHIGANIAANLGTIGVLSGNTLAAFINGPALVDGGVLNAGSSASQAGGLIAIGENAQGQQGTLTATMTVQNAGTVTDTYLDLSSDPMSSGTLTLTGAGTQWNDAGDANDPTTTRGDILLGNNNQSSNTPVPPFIAPAQLLVENSAALTEATYAEIANSNDSGGNATITSNGIWNIGTSAFGGFLTVGNRGTGTLLVSAGGTVDIHKGTGTFFSNGTSFTGSGIGIGNHPGASGTLTVDGSGSLLTTPNGMGVGQSGQGELIIQNGGTVSLGIGSANGLSIGQTLGASGTVTVNGTTSLLSSANGFGVGNAGTGTLTVENGGTANTNGLGIGQTAGGSGTVTVTGNGSIINVSTNGIGVGKLTTGLLQVENGGIVTSGTNGIGAANTISSVSGTIFVDGVGSRITTPGGIGLGRAGHGTLEVQNSGSVQLITSNLNLGGNGNGPTGGTALTTVGSGGQIEAGNNLDVWQGSTVAVLDGTSGIDVGASGAAQSGDILVEAGHTLYGDGVVNAAVQNDGTVASTNSGTFSASTGGTLDVNGAVTGTGLLTLTKNSVLEIGGSLGVGQTALFNAGTETLVLATPGSGLGNPLDSVGIGDRIEFGNGMTITAVNMLTTGGTITNPNTAEVHFHGSGGLTGSFDLTDINFAADGSNGFTFGHDATTGDDFIQAAPCFAVGTRISTERGEVAVEQLRVGDRVCTVLGEQSPPVVWIGHRRIACGRHPDPRQVWPVRISTDAFGPGRPGRELWLSPDHAVYIGDVLIPVKCLINGGSIAQMPVDEVTYYHVELPDHSVMLAEGLPAESYLDTGDRANFSNGGGPIALYPDFASRVWEAKGCAPLVVTGPALDAALRWAKSLTAMPRTTSAA